MCEHSIAALADESGWDLATVARWEFRGDLGCHWQRQGGCEEEEKDVLSPHIFITCSLCVCFFKCLNTVYLKSSSGIMSRLSMWAKVCGQMYVDNKEIP